MPPRNRELMINRLIPPAFVLISAPDRPPTRRALSQRTVVGRSPVSDLCLDHLSVSRRHAELFVDGGQWAVRDLESHNGTTVNGKPVNEQTLRHNDVIGLGAFEMRFELENASTENLELAADEAEEPLVSPLRGAAPELSAQLFAQVLAFGKDLSEIPSRADRLQRLFDLVLSPQIGGWWCHALNVEQRSGPLAVTLLCPPRASSAGEQRTPHISRSVLAKVLAANEPVITSSTGKLSHFQADVSMVDAASPVSAVVCPLGPLRESGSGTPHTDAVVGGEVESSKAIELLYVTLPPSVASVQWLALIGLAVEQFRHADSSAAVKAAAEERAIHDREMAWAREIQQHTLPRRKLTRGLSWAWRFEPCRIVGGDYVDILIRADGKTLLLIADVAGKGVQAALIASKLHTIFHTAEMHKTLPQLIDSADRYLRTTLPSGAFVTLAALLVDPVSGIGSCINCGHLPIFALSRAGTSRILDGGDNFPLAVGQADYKSTPIQLVAHEWIALYTDGLTEMRNPAGEMLGITGVREMLQKLAVSESPLPPAEDFADRLLAALETFRQSTPAADDLTFLLIRRE